MRDDYRHSTLPQFAEGLGHLLGDAVIAELHEKITGVVDDVSLRVGKGVLHVLIGQVEVAPQTDFRSISRKLLQVFDQSCQVFAVVMIAVIGVRRGDHVGNAVGGSCSTHLHAYVPGFRAIVDFGQDMGVDIDHAGRHDRSNIDKG